MPGTALRREYPLRPMPAGESNVTDIDAHDVILQLEAVIQKETLNSAPKKQRQEAGLLLMYCRIIGHFFHCVPSNSGMNTLVHDVQKAQGEKEKMLDVGKFCYDHAMRVFRSAKERTLAVSTNPSCESFDDLGDKDELRKPPLNHKDAKKNSLITFSVFHCYPINFFGRR